MHFMLSVAWKVSCFRDMKYHFVRYTSSLLFANKFAKYCAVVDPIIPGTFFYLFRFSPNISFLTKSRHCSRRYRKQIARRICTSSMTGGVFVVTEVSELMISL